MRPPSWLFSFLFLAAASLLAGCAGEAPPPPPPPEVRVITLEPQPVINVVTLPGRVQAVRTAEIRARVDGIIQRRLYEEGSNVKAGTGLFLIDPREMLANLQEAKAALQRAEAIAANAAQDVARYKGLVPEQAISQQEYDAALARLRTAQADVAQTRAQVRFAQLNLDYTKVTSPIAGRAGRAQVTEGALVSRAEATLLTTVEQYDPIYVNFSQSSSELLELRQQVRSGTLKIPAPENIDVTLVLEDGSPYPYSGYIDFYSLTIDQATGTAAFRAEFPNPERMLLPGQFVEARVEAGVRPGGMTVPQRAVQVAEEGATVLLVGENDIVAVRPVEVGELLEGAWVIRQGLQAGDRVIVEGLQKAQPGKPVRVAAGEEAREPASPPPAGGG